MDPRKLYFKGPMRYRQAPPYQYVELDPLAKTMLRVHSKLSQRRVISSRYFYRALGASPDTWLSDAIKDLASRGFVQIYPKDLQLDEGI